MAAVADKVKQIIVEQLGVDENQVDPKPAVKVREVNDVGKNVRCVGEEQKPRRAECEEPPTWTGTGTLMIAMA